MSADRRTVRVRAAERAAANAHLTSGPHDVATLTAYVTRYYAAADAADTAADAQHYARLAQQYQHATDAVRYGTA